MVDDNALFVDFLTEYMVLPIMFTIDYGVGNIM